MAHGTTLSVAAARNRLRNREVTERKQVGDAESLMNQAERAGSGWRGGGADEWLE
jgi:hypothetical protein